MADTSTPTGVLMVGSVPLGSTKEVLTKVSNALPQRLQAIPDGETGMRWNYIGWQLSCFPPDARRSELGGVPVPVSGKLSYSLESIRPTRYDEAAVESYSEFVALRKAGVVESDVRFQICLPTPFNSVIGHVKPELREEIEPLYETRFQQTLDRIVEKIPHGDMVIQWDMCFDVTALEYESGRLTEERHKAYFTPVLPGILDRLRRMCQRIPTAVGLAFHLCYGDLGHKHFIEPADTALVVGLANSIISMLSKTHKVEWIHIPVPRNRIDREYFAPLNELQLGDTNLYLGLVHANDESGTLERIKTARTVYSKPFGVATECGLGRTPTHDIDSILAIAKSVTTPQRQGNL